MFEIYVKSSEFGGILPPLSPLILKNLQLFQVILKLTL